MEDGSSGRQVDVKGKHQVIDSEEKETSTR